MGWIREEVPNGITEYNEVLYFDDTKKHYLAVGKSKYTESYHIWYVLCDAMRIKGPFEASSMEDAKAKALARVRSYIGQHAQYWLKIQNQIDSAL